MPTTISKTLFSELRNSIYGGLLESGKIQESDRTFIEIENLIIETKGLEIDWEDESPLEQDVVPISNTEIEVARNFLNSDEYSIKDQVIAIKTALVEGDKTMIIDYIDKVQPIEKYENVFCVEGFVNLIQK